MGQTGGDPGSAGDRACRADGHRCRPEMPILDRHQAAADHAEPRTTCWVRTQALRAVSRADGRVVGQAGGQASRQVPELDQLKVASDPDLGRHARKAINSPSARSGGPWRLVP